MPAPWLKIMVLLVLISILSACGQKGDLYLPVEQPDQTDKEQTE